MSVFNNIAAAVFAGAAAADPATVQPKTPATPPAAKPVQEPAPGQAAAATAAAVTAAAVRAAAGAPARPAAAAPSRPAPTTAPAAVAAPLSLGEVEAMIEKIAAGQKAKSNYKQSIVDLMKLLQLDSSLAARKELAQELGYSGALDGSAAMNTWLHRQVMERLAASGGRVPDSLKS